VPPVFRVCPATGAINWAATSRHRAASIALSHPLRSNNCGVRSFIPCVTPHKFWERPCDSHVGISSGTNLSHKPIMKLPGISSFARSFSVVFLFSIPPFCSLIQSSSSTHHAYLFCPDRRGSMLAPNTFIRKTPHTLQGCLKTSPKAVYSLRLWHLAERTGRRWQVPSPHFL